MVPGFESYLTAYPLPRSSLVAFARTWTAPEMPRPGCVWTHTLLIEQKEKTDPAYTFPGTGSEPLTVNVEDLPQEKQKVAKEIEEHLRERLAR